MGLLGGWAGAVVEKDDDVGWAAIPSSMAAMALPALLIRLEGAELRGRWHQAARVLRRAKPPAR